MLITKNYMLFHSKLFTCIRAVEEDTLKSEFSIVCFKASVPRKSISRKVI